MLHNYISTITYDVNNPLPTDGDSVYVKDIDAAYCTKVGWTGEFYDLFGHPNSITGMYNDTVTNPKVIYLAFNRTLYLHAVGIGCNLVGKSFSNIKLEFIGSDGTVRYTYDDSANNTKYGTRLYSFVPAACVGLKISVCTANTDVGISNITIQKETATTTRMEALKPDSTIVDIKATAAGNLKVSVEELEGGISVNSNSQLMVTPFLSDGTAINLQSATINEYNITLTDADTEYSQALPDNTKMIEFQARTFVDIRWSFTTGKVATPTAPYQTLKAGNHQSREGLLLSSKTLYLATDVAGTIIELVAYS